MTKGQKLRARRVAIWQLKNWARVSGVEMLKNLGGALALGAGFYVLFMLLYVAA